VAIEKILVSDVSGAREAETTTLGFKSVWYEIDLTASEQDDLERLLSPYLLAGRRRGARLVKSDGPITTSDERVRIRAWASERGLEFSRKGRIPKWLYAAYHEASQADV